MSATADSSRGELPMNENCGQDMLRSDAAKWLRLIVPGEQRGFYEFTARGQNKISFSNFTPGSVVEVARGILKTVENFSEKGKRNDFNRNRSSPVPQEGI